MPTEKPTTSATTPTPTAPPTAPAHTHQLPPNHPSHPPPPPGSVPLTAAAAMGKTPDSRPAFMTNQDRSQATAETPETPERQQPLGRLPPAVLLRTRQRRPRLHHRPNFPHSQLSACQCRG